MPLLPVPGKTFTLYLRAYLQALSVFVMAGFLHAEKAPSFNFYLKELSSGKPVLLKNEIQGRTVILSFWASYCTSCREEIPALKKLIQSYPGARLIFINVDPLSRNAAVKDLSLKWSVTGTSLWDPYQIAAKRTIPDLRLPASVLVSNGEILLRMYGFGDQEKKLLSEHLNAL